MKKKIVALLLASALAVLTACAGAPGVTYDPSAASPKEAVEASSEETEASAEEASAPKESVSELSGDNVVEYDGGIRIAYPDDFINTKGVLDVYSSILNGDSGVYMTYFSYAGVTEEWFEEAFNVDEPSPEDEEKYANSVAALTYVFAIDDNRGVGELIDYLNENDPDTTLTKESFQEIGKAEDCTFFRMYEFDKDQAENLEEGFKEEFEALYDELGGLLEKAEYFKPVPPYEGLVGTKVAFETTDIDGNPITSDEIFSKHEVTMVNVWATWCTWCVYELPELNEINKRLEAKDCAIVGLVGDGTDEDTIKEAKQLLKENGDEYLNILPWDGALTDAFPMESGWPTSFFVDREGTIVSTPVAGAAIKTYEGVIDQILENGTGEVKAQDQSPVSENNVDQYRIYVSDTDGKKVSGAMIQLCDDSTCRVEMTDDSGLAVFKVDKADYTVHVLKQPQGYKEDNTEYKVPDEYSDLHVILEKE